MKENLDSNTSSSVNEENIGITFFTKPRINLSDESLSADFTLSTLGNVSLDSPEFIIRSNLDRSIGDKTSPFIIPASNLLIGVQGWPDLHSSDEPKMTYDLSFKFKGVQGGFLQALFYYWVYSMSLQCEGVIAPYATEESSDNLNYSCSVYRAMTDPSGKIITRWSKASRCYPVGVDVSDVFNFDEIKPFVSSQKDFEIPFKAGKIEHMNPDDLETIKGFISV